MIVIITLKKKSKSKGKFNFYIRVNMSTPLHAMRKMLNNAFSYTVYFILNNEQKGGNVKISKEVGLIKSIKCLCLSNLTR